MDYPGDVPRGCEERCEDSGSSPEEVRRSPSPEKALLAWRAAVASLAELADLGSYVTTQKQVAESKSRNNRC